jgi:formate dehydrogenase alpha subunit
MKPASTISLTIDGQSALVREGATLLDAARSLGIVIPTLCHIPLLPARPVCRVCLVHVEHDGAVGLRTACSTAAEEGMEVRTEAEEAVKARLFGLELLLADHPADCFPNERGSRCELHLLARRYNLSGGRFDRHRAPFPIDDSHPFIRLDLNRCILCRRCVRACGEIQGHHVLGIAERGDRSLVIADDSRPLGRSTCVSCGECVAYCPTGALVERLPGWPEGAGALEAVTTICPYCGCGCQLDLQVQAGRVIKVGSNFDGPANKGSLCAKGRFGYQFIHSPDRLKAPLIREGHGFREATWEEALDLVARRLLEIRACHGPDAVGVVSSAKATNEENYLLQKLARAVLGTNNVDNCARLCHAPTGTALLAAFGGPAATNSFEDLEQAQALLVVGSNTTEQHPIAALPMKRLVERGIPLIVVDPRQIELARLATVHLAIRPGTDLAVLNGMAHVILGEGLWDQGFVHERTEGFEEMRATVRRYPPEMAASIAGIDPDVLCRAARLYATRRPASIYYTMGVTQHTSGHQTVLALANLALLTGNLGKPGAGLNPLRGQNNVQGACDMGALPNALPGYQSLEDAEVRAKFEAAWGRAIPKRLGLTLTQIFGGKSRDTIRGLYLVGENALLTQPDMTTTEAVLRGLDFLVVQDLFLTETAKLAHVVLPAASFAEKDGTFTNTERRVQQVRRAVEPPGQAMADWQIVCALSRRLGYPMAYAHPREIMAEIARLVPIYGGISYERLEAASLQWPCPRPDHPGTPILYTRRFPRGRARFHPVDWLPPAEVPDADFPLVLTSGRTLFQYHTGTMSRRSEGLNLLEPEPFVEVSGVDAKRVGVSEGQMAAVVTRRGRIYAKVRVEEGIPPGVIFTTFHFAEAPANRLTNPALDPIALIPEFKVCAARLEQVAGGTGAVPTCCG